MRRVYLIIIILITTSCYNRFNEPEYNEPEYNTNYTIERLHTNLGTKSYSDISEDLTIKGVVTANDQSGNLYNSLFIEHDGYAVEILVELSNSHVIFPEGNTLYVNLKGLRTLRSYGVVQIGSPAANMGEIEEISSMSIINEYINVSTQHSEVEPLVITLDQIVNSTERSSYYGRLIEIENMVLEPNEYLNPNNLWSGTNTFTQYDTSLSEDEYHSISIYTSSYANYSQTTIPSGSCTLRGILQSANSNYLTSTSLSLTMRRSDDCIPNE